MGERPKGMTLDRIDNDGNYEPGNLRWATRHTQTINSRMRSDNTTGYIGVYEIKYRYTANIGINGNYIPIGRFKTKKEAVEARNQYIRDNNLTEYEIQNYKDEFKD